jgi:hypothetical protein
MTPGGITPLWGGRDHPGIGGRHHSVTRGDIIPELGGGFLRNQHCLSVAAPKATIDVVTTKVIARDGSDLADDKTIRQFEGGSSCVVGIAGYASLFACH